MRDQLAATGETYDDYLEYQNAGTATCDYVKASPARGLDYWAARCATPERFFNDLIFPKVSDPELPKATLSQAQDLIGDLLADFARRHLELESSLGLLARPDTESFRVLATRWRTRLEMWKELDAYLAPRLSHVETQLTYILGAPIDGSYFSLPPH